MARTWTKGQDLVGQSGMYYIELVEHVIDGLQPYDEEGRPIPPPHVKDWVRLIEGYRQEVARIENQFPQFRDMHYTDEWNYELYVNREEKPDGRWTKILYPDGSDSEIRQDYDGCQIEIRKIELRLSSYKSLPSWKGYKRFQAWNDAELVKTTLLNACFRCEDILNLTGERPEPKDSFNSSEKRSALECTLDSVEKRPEEGVKNSTMIESVIQSLTFIPVGDTEIKISLDRKKYKKYNLTDLEFKSENVKTWRAFRSILKSNDHFYHVGIARFNNGRNKDYDKNQKILKEINKKLVEFLHNNYDIDFPEQYKLYESAKQERSGTYTFKFRIKRENDYDFRAYPKGKLIKHISSLSLKRKSIAKNGGEAGENFMNDLTNELYEAIAVATKNEWIGANETEYYLKEEVDFEPILSLVECEESSGADEDQPPT